MSDEERKAGFLTPGLRWTTVAILLGLAVAHVVWPQLAIDGTLLGLLGGAGLFAFFEIDSVEWKGIKARRLRKTIAEAEEAVEAIEDPAEPLSLPSPPEVRPGQVTAPASVEVVHHREPPSLSPPVEPLERFLWATELIRVELIVLAGNSGNLPDFRQWHAYGARFLAQELTKKAAIPGNYHAVVKSLMRLRDRIVHDQAGLGASDYTSAAEIAMNLLEHLTNIRRQYARVVDPFVELYKDQSLTARHDANGVRIATLDEEGSVLASEIYPKADAYQRGRFVSWAWDETVVHPQPAWYFDRVAQQARQAFSSSATFVGREYPDQWALEARFPRPDVGLD